MNQPAINHCYTDHAAKNRAWLAHVLPQLFKLPRAVLNNPGQVTALETWLQDAGLSLDLGGNNVTPNVLYRLHELARQGDYIPLPIPCDVVFWPSQTLTSGGKCSDWLVVLASVLTAWGRPWRIMTAGDEQDKFRHVWIQAGDAAGAWRNLDPKGSERGLDFGDQVRGAGIVQAWEAA